MPQGLIAEPALYLTSTLPRMDPKSQGECAGLPRTRINWVLFRWVMSPRELFNPSETLLLG